MAYANDIMHSHIQMKAENIYKASIYMYARLVLGVYGPYTYTFIYANIEACTQSGANIYIYIHLNLGAQG